MSILHALQPTDSAVLEHYLQPQSVSAGTRLFRAGSQGDCCYLVDAGRVRLELEQPELDSDAVLGFLEAGSLLGELSLLDQEPRSASAYADTDLQVRRLDTAGLARLTAEHPALAARVYQALGRGAAQKLRQSNLRLAETLADEQDPEVEELVGRAEAALAQIADLPEARIDAVLTDMAQAVAAQAQNLAEATVAATRVGNVADKTIKNRMASLGVLESLLGQSAGGPLEWDPERRVQEIAAPMGVVFGMIPLTNPVATAIFKSLIAIKSRSAIILSFQRASLPLAEQVGEIIQGVLRRHDLPAELVQWVRQRGSRKKTELLMAHPRVSLVLATGGASMVRAAYSSGTPAIGVGPGNAPTLICADADLQHAAYSVVLSKSFDNGLICGSEHNLVVVESARAGLVEALTASGAAVLTEAETARFVEGAVVPGKGAFRRKLIGQSAAAIAEQLGIERDYEIKLIVVPTEGVGPDNALSGEKMAAFVSLYTVADERAGIELSLDILRHQGLGHTAIIHSTGQDWIDAFGRAMPASRILVNSPGSHGVVGLTTGLTPSLTLGCGSFGHNSTTDNVTYRHLLNIKRVAHFRQPSLDLAG